MPRIPDDWFHNMDIEDVLTLAVGIAISLGVLVLILVAVFAALDHFLGLPFLVTAALTLIPALLIAAGVLWVLGNSSSTSWGCSTVPVMLALAVFPYGVVVATVIVGSAFILTA